MNGKSRDAGIELSYLSRLPNEERQALTKRQWQKETRQVRVILESMQTRSRSRKAIHHFRAVLERFHWTTYEYREVPRVLQKEIENLELVLKRDSAGDIRRACNFCFANHLYLTRDA